MKKHLVGLAYLGKAQVYYLMGDIAAASTFVEQALGCVSLHDDSVSVPEVYG